MSDKTARAAEYLSHILQAITRIERYTVDLGVNPTFVSTAAI